MSDFSILNIHHSSVIVSDLEVALEFYRDFLGLRVDHSRSIKEYEGAWLWAGDQQIHLLVLPNPDPAEGRPLHVGRDRHLALSVHGFEAFCEHLEDAGIPHTRSKSGRKAVFFRDPDQNGLEIVGI